MFSSLAEMVEAAEQQGKPLSEVVITTELKQSRRTRAEVWERMRQRLLVMRRSAGIGIAQPVQSLSGISGGNAYKFWQWLEAGNQPLSGPILSRAVARAMAVNEVNAGMGCIVATPTAGSAGILPGVLLTLQEMRGFDDDDLVAALFTASGIGGVIILRAHVSGAAGGCQARNWRSAPVVRRKQAARRPWPRARPSSCWAARRANPRRRWPSP